MGCNASIGAHQTEQGLVNKLLFPAPQTSSYADWNFKGELLWLPLANYAGLLGGPEKKPSDNYAVPCCLFQNEEAQYILIYLHKNADDLGLCRSFCRKLGETLGVHVLCVEYPGYGLCSSVAPTASQVIKHVFAALAFVQKALNWPLENVLLFGVSLGAGPALAVAAEVDVAGLVLVAPFLNLRQMFRDHVGRFASLVAEQFPNDKLVALIRSPTLIFHGQQDKMVPVSHSETLHSRLKCRSKFVSPLDATHHTNLLLEEDHLITPMRDLFSLPGKGSKPLVVPPWAFQRRLCLLSSAPES